MHSPGPSSMFTSCAAHSSPSASPTSSASSSFQPEAMETAVGKHVAGMLAFRPRWSEAAACFLSP